MADKKIDDDDDGNVDDDGDDGMMMMTRFNWLQDKWSFVGSNLMPRPDRRTEATSLS